MIKNEVFKDQERAEDFFSVELLKSVGIKLRVLWS